MSGKQRFLLLKPVPSNILPPTKTHFLSALKHGHQLRTKCLKAWDYGAHLQTTTQHKHENLISGLQHLWGFTLVILVQWKQRQLTGAHWPVSLAKSVSPGPNKRSCLKKQGE